MTAEPLPTTLLYDRMPDWWRPLALDLDGERIARRRRGVEALREALSLENVIDAVGYAHGDADAGGRIIGTVRTAARSVDGAFAGDLGDAEPPALVAAALADQLAVDPGSDLSTLVSLLVLSADYGGHAPAISGMRLAEYAARQLEHVAVSARRTIDQPPTAGKLVEDALEVLEANRMRPPGPDTASGGALPAYRQILIGLARRIDEVDTRAAAAHAVLREQLRQQTWLLESWCETAAMPWEQVPLEARPLIAAAELAERTEGNVPAIHVQSLLGSVLAAAGGSGKVEPDAAVEAAASFLEGSVTRAPSPMLFPLTAALSRSREREGAIRPEGAIRSAGASGWESAIRSEGAIGWDRAIPSEGAIHPEGAIGWEGGTDPADPTRQQDVVLSMQAYREALALRILGYE